MRWWWLSFASDSFLGVTIVEGTDIITAAQRAHELGINPGGQVVGLEIPVHRQYPPSLYNRLLNRQEAMEWGKSLRETEETDA